MQWLKGQTNVPSPSGITVSDSVPLQPTIFLAETSVTGLSPRKSQPSSPQWEEWFMSLKQGKHVERVATNRLPAPDVTQQVLSNVRTRAASFDQTSRADSSCS